jgi:hypothetical protein
MTITIVTALFSYALDAVLVGIGFAIVSRRLRRPGSSIRDFVLLCGVFAVLDLIWIPAISELGMSISFDNPAVYGIFGIENPIRGEDLFGLDFISVVFWFLQALLARATAVRILQTEQPYNKAMKSDVE